MKRPRQYEFFIKKLPIIFTVYISSLIFKYIFSNSFKGITFFSNIVNNKFYTYYLITFTVLIMVLLVLLLSKRKDIVKYQKKVDNIVIKPTGDKIKKYN